MKTIAERVAQLKIKYPWRMQAIRGGEKIETMLITLEEAEAVFTQQLQEQQEQILEELYDGDAFGILVDILNCYEIDAYEVRHGMTYIDSDEATKISKEVIGRLKQSLDKGKHEAKNSL